MFAENNFFQVSGVPGIFLGTVISIKSRNLQRSRGRPKSAPPSSFKKASFLNMRRTLFINFFSVSLSGLKNTRRDTHKAGKQLLPHCQEQKPTCFENFSIGKSLKVPKIDL